VTPKKLVLLGVLGLKKLSRPNDVISRFVKVVIERCGLHHRP